VPMPDISTDAIDVSLNWQTPDKSVSVTIFSEPDGNSVTAAWLNRKTQVHGSCAFRLNSNDLSDRYAQVLISLRISAFFAPSQALGDTRIRAAASRCVGSDFIWAFIWAFIIATELQIVS